MKKNKSPVASFATGISKVAFKQICPFKLFSYQTVLNDNMLIRIITLFIDNVITVVTDKTWQTVTWFRADNLRDALFSGEVINYTIIPVNKHCVRLFIHAKVEYFTEFVHSPSAGLLDVV